MLESAVEELLAEARTTNERRLLVLAGDGPATAAAARRVHETLDLDPGTVTLLTDRDVDLDGAERLPLERSGDLLGTTREAVVLDCHDATRPNALGRAAGVVDGGGLLVLLTPPLETWPERRDGFDERLAAPPFDVESVAGNFRRRLVETLRAHRGVAIWDADAAELRRDGRTHPAPRLPTPPPALPDAHAFPRAAYEACLTADQVEAVRAFEALREPDTAVVCAADRGRGKSSAAGLAAGALAAEGRTVVVTAPGYRNAREVFARAGELLERLDALESEDRRQVVATGGGRVRFVAPEEAEAATDSADALVVDEAASFPVRALERFLASGLPVAFTTTVHGYEGAGRGFDVRFRDRLAGSDREVTDVTMGDPVRYAAGDPVEVWAFRALLLDARPPVADLLADATPEQARYVALDAERLLADENRLREAFGLLVLAHYRTEPDDLARLLDAPNVAVRALTVDSRVAAVALLAREGGLAADRRARMYDGERVRGNMLPDVLTTQLRDETAGAPVGVRVLRIATHHAVRSRGLGSHLLGAIEREFADPSDPPEGGDDRDPDTGAHLPAAWPDVPVDYLGVGYGATPPLLRFWRQNGYRTVHLSTTRNDASGEHSALMVRPLTPEGRDLHDRSARFFAARVGSVLADPLREADPDVVRETLRATDAGVDSDLSAREWRVVASAAFGPGTYDAAPRPFRRLALRALVEGSDLPADAERLLVRKVLQGWPWERVAGDLGYVSKRQVMRTLGSTYRPLVERYGTRAALAEADRYR